MPDLYLTIAEQPEEVLAAVAEAMDVRAADPAMRAITERYLAPLPAVVRALEVGCGAGGATAAILEHLAVETYVAVDPAPGLVERARARFAHDPRVRISVGSAAATGEPADSYDLVLAHTVYSHLAEPDAAIAEAMRVLRPGGRLVVFDGDYASLTVARGDADPLQAALELVKRHMIHGPYVMRSLPRRLDAVGFAVERSEPFAYLGGERPDYFLTLFARGLAAAGAAGEIGPDFAAGVLAEARRRVAAGTFFAAVLFMSVVARKPAA